MTTTSINSNIAAKFAASHLNAASRDLSIATARLASGNRIVCASDDVANLSIGSSLRASVATLRIAKLNTSLGSSLLQVADGALAQIVEILQRQLAIATQAGSGSLTSTERSFLNQEFQALASEINRLVAQTNFNGVKLLDGSLTNPVRVLDKTTQSGRASATLTFSDNPDNNETVMIDGVTITFVTSGASGLQVTLGATTAQSVRALAQKLNNVMTDSAFTSAQKLAISKMSFEAKGSTLFVKSRSGGTLGEVFRISMAGTAADTSAEAGIGGKYGGSYFTVFTTGFASSTAVIAATTTAASTPFQIGAVIRAAFDPPAGPNLKLHTVVAGDTLQSIVNGINAKASSTGVRAELTYTSALTYNIRLEYEDHLSDVFFIGGANYNSGTHAIAAPNTTVNQTVYALRDGSDAGLGIGRTAVAGSVGEDILTGLVQTRAKVVMSFPEIADADLTSTANFGNSSGVRISVGGHNFVFTTNGTGKAADEITIGATLEETLDNAVATINAYLGVGSEEFQLNQIRVTRDGRNLVFESRDVANVVDLSGATSTVSITNMSTVSTTNSGNLNNSDTGGVVVSGISNADFVGTISGFKATYKSSDTVDLSIKIGNYTYTAQGVDSTPTGDTTIRLFSDTLADGTNGGYFDIELKGNKGESVSAQPAADTFAARLNAAFGTLSFYQRRGVSSYTGNEAIVSDGTVTGSLVGSKVDIQLSSFSDVKIDSIEVTAPQGSNPNGSIAIVVNGETFLASSSLGSKLGANQTYRLTSVVDANKYIEFTTGNSTIDFSTDAKATAFESALKKAFGVGDGSAQLAFQVGATTADTLKIGINDVSTDAIYGGISLDVLTQAAAQLASDTIGVAIKGVTSVRADVGALQSRFNFAAANIESTIQNQDAARGELLDTDIAQESTAFAVAQVKLQAGIAALAQVNQQLQSVLKLLG